MTSRVLFFGHCHGIFAQPLCSHLKAALPLRIGVLELLSPGSERRMATGAGAFDDHVELPHAGARSGAQLLRRALANPAASVLGLARTVARSPTAASLRGHLRSEARRAAHTELLDQFDLFHLHYAAPMTWQVVELLRDGAPLIVSMWGSDLLRTSGVESYQRQESILARATIITVRSLDLREVLLAKFGRHLAPKVRIAKFGSGMLDHIDAFRDRVDRAQLARSLGLDAAKSWICLGHSGDPDNQHEAILGSLGTLDESTKRSISCIAFTTYGDYSDHRTRLLERAAQLGLELRVLDRFLGVEELARLRLSTDVFVHVPVSDALSAAMSETLYAGNPVIAGAWLPYGELRRRCVPLFQVESADDVAPTLAHVLAQLASARAALEGVRPALRSVLSWQEVAPAWVAIYRELIALN